MPARRLHEPWRAFLGEVDEAVAGVTELHCFGGFVLAEFYGLTRPTADVDILHAKGSADPAALAAIAGRGSPLAKKHRVFLDLVTIASVPDGYEERLLPMFDSEFERLRLRAFEKHDLALAKLTATPTTIERTSGDWLRDRGWMSMNCGAAITKNSDISLDTLNGWTSPWTCGSR